MALQKEKLVALKEWLESETIDDPEDLFEEIHTIIALIDFWLEALKGNNDK